jgi:hypothetical protein
MVILTASFSLTDVRESYLDEGEDARDQKPRKDVVMVFKRDLDLDEVILGHILALLIAIS